MMFVDGDAVEAEFVGEAELVEILMIEFGAQDRIVMGVGIGQPRGAVLLDGVEIGMRVGHEVEVEDLHAVPFDAMRSRMMVSSAAGASTCGACPQSGMIETFEPGISRAHSCA